MENFRSLTVKELQAKCKEGGLSCSGRKNQLIERLEEKYNRPGLNERIAQLEETIAGLREQASRFEPTETSSTMQAFSSPVGSPVHALSYSVSSGNTLPISSAVGSRMPTTSLTTVYSQQPISMQSSLPQQVPSTRYIYQHPVCVPYIPPRLGNQQNLAVPTAGQQTAPCYGTSTQQQMPTTHVPTSYVDQHILSPPNAYVQQPHVLPSSVQNNGLYPNPYGNIREILAILPEFNPSSDESVNSSQFVKRVETLKAAYGWDDQSLIFAVQQKMQGSAKYWVDSLQIVFLSCQDFVRKFLQDFPHVDNAADIHIRMSRMKRRVNESPQEYYFRMFAVGTKGNIPESAIARHIINGINDADLKRKVSNEYSNCNQLYRDLNIYCNYNDIATPYATVHKQKPIPPNERNAVNPRTTKINENNNATISKVKCFNCFGYGHYSIKCPEPQRKERCKNCNRTTHTTTECTATRKQQTNNVI